MSLRPVSRLNVSESVEPGPGVQGIALQRLGRELRRWEPTGDPGLPLTMLTADLPRVVIGHSRPFCVPLIGTSVTVPQADATERLGTLHNARPPYVRSGMR